MQTFGIRRGYSDLSVPHSSIDRARQIVNYQRLSEEVDAVFISSYGRLSKLSALIANDKIANVQTQG